MDKPLRDSPQPAVLTLRLDTSEPIELSAFVGAFTSLGNEFKRHMREIRPDLPDEATIYVKEVRKGSIVADLISFAQVSAPFIAHTETLNVMIGFVDRWRDVLESLRSGSPVASQPLPSRTELADWTDAVQAIARDPNASSTLEAATFEDGKREVRAAFKFDTRQARQIEETLGTYRRNLETQESNLWRRVLMTFTRSDVGRAQVGKRSGERVKIEEISPKSLALIYGSEIAGDAIKREIRDGEENVFKKGFVVDVMVKTREGLPIGYSVIEVHQVIDLPDDDETE